MKGGTRLDEGNFIAKHWLEAHPTLNRPPGIKFQVKNSFKDALSREVEEALKIEKANSDHSLSILSSKSEWSSGSLTRL